MGPAEPSREKEKREREGDRAGEQIKQSGDRGWLAKDVCNVKARRCQH